MFRGSTVAIDRKQIISCNELNEELETCLELTFSTPTVACQNSLFTISQLDGSILVPPTQDRRSSVLWLTRESLCGHTQLPSWSLLHLSPPVSRSFSLGHLHCGPSIGSLVLIVAVASTVLIFIRSFAGTSAGSDLEDIILCMFTQMAW